MRFRKTPKFLLVGLAFTPPAGARQKKEAFHVFPSPFFSLFFALLIVLGMAAYYPVTVCASIGFQPISPEELKMTSEPLAPGAPAVILFRQVDRDDNGLTSHEDNYYRIKILTEEGREYSEVKIPCFKERGNIVGIRARTIRPDGTVVNFEGKVIEKFIDNGRGLKYWAKTFTLPDVQVGSIIEYYYTEDLSETNIFDSHWILSNELFTERAKFSLKPYEAAGSPKEREKFVDLADRYGTSGRPLQMIPYTPEGFVNYYHLRWTSQGLPPGTTGPKAGPDHVIRLEVRNIPAFQTEEFMPPENELKSRVDFVYSRELPTQDVNKFWIKTGKKLNSQLEIFVGKRKSMVHEVEEIVAPNDSPEIKLRKIYARVQQMRNTSYEVQRTEQEEERENEKSAKTAEDVWKSGYGGRDQLTWLFLALVRAAGFEAYGVWASDRENYFFSPVWMDRGRLDANIVLVKLNGKDLYFDPGVAFTPFGLLPWAETSVQGLRMDKRGGTWVTNDASGELASRIERRANLKLSDTGDLEGKLTVTFTGLEAHSRRLDERNVDEVGRKQFLERQVKEFIPAASEVDLVNKPEWTSSAPTLVAEFNLKVPGWASVAGHRAVVPVGLFSASEKHVFDPVTRVHPIYMEFPCQRLDDVTIEIPSGWQVTSLPPGQSQLGHIVEYSLKVENDKGKLHLQRILNLGIVLLEAKDYPPLRKFFQVVKTADERQIVLQSGRATASK